MSKYFIVLLLSTLSAFALSGCGGSDSATSTVTAPSALSYTSPASGTVGVAVTPLAPTVTGVVTGYTVSPALPAGLSLDSATGAISGTPTAAAPEATYTITASNSAGSTRFSWVFTVNAATALEISSLSESTAAVFSPLTIKM